MKKVITIVVFLLLYLTFLADTKAQILIGFNKNQIQSIIAKHKPSYEPVEFTFENKSFGEPVAYKDDDRMHIYVIGSNGICHTYTQAYNYSYLNNLIKGFNNNYVKRGEWEWLDYKEEVTYLYRIEKIEDSFLVIAVEYNSK